MINRSAYGLPQYETGQAAGLDVRANITESITLGPLERALVPTGLYVELPEDYEMQIRPAAVWRPSTGFRWSIRRVRSIPITAVRSR